MPFPTLGPNEVALAVPVPDPPAVALLPERAIPALGWDTKPAWLLDAPPLTRVMPTSTATRAATMSSRLEKPLAETADVAACATSLITPGNPKIDPTAV